MASLANRSREANRTNVLVASSSSPLRELTANNPSARPVWQWTVLSFVASAALALALVALAQPFDRNGQIDLPAYETGFADGLRSGAETAHHQETERVAIAYRRGREAGRAQAGSESLGESRGESSEYQRGYRDGYAEAQEAERS